MDNQDKTTFSLDDDEIVEEEVIDRDEEYDDEDYDDYGDEEYGDEEYDEDYDDGYDEEYDDGYNDDYYDDRLNKVLDELAELKRGMVPANAPAAVQPQPIMPPQYIYQPTAPPAGSEVVMYNEISRLRDELARNQNSLEMQKELTRIKEDMQRDQKFAEAQYNAEIQRLQSKIDDLLKNGSSPQGELPAGNEPARLEGGNTSGNLDKLLAINESILRAMRDSDARVQSEIAQLKKQLEDIPSVKELNGAVSSVKKAANNLDVGNLSKLSGDIAALKSLFESGVPAAAPAPSAQPQVVVSRGDSDVSASELLRQLYDIKTIIGNTSPDAVKRAQTISELVNEFKKVSYDVHSQTASYKDKLNSVYAYVKRLTDTNEPDAIDLVLATNTLIGELGSQPLDKQIFSAVAEFCAERGMTTINSAMRDSAERFFGLSQKISEAPVDSYGNYLPDLVDAINTLQGKKHESENAAAVGEITTKLLDENSDKSAVKDMVAQLIKISVSDVLDLPKIEMPDSYTPASAAGEANIFTKLEEIKTAIADRPPTIISSSGDGELSADEAALQQIIYAVDELKNKLESATGANDMSGALEELRSNYLDITNRLVEVSEKLQDQPAAYESNTAYESHADYAGEDGTDGAAVSAGISEEERQIMLDDLGYIRAKLDDYESLLNGIADMRDSLTTLGGSAEAAEQITLLTADIAGQFDKLYEDISNVIIESEANLAGRLEQGVSVDAIDVAKADILAETQAIKDSLANVSDSILMSPTAEAVEQLRADFNSYVDLSATHTDAAAADRQRLLEDIAFLREQAELALAESEQVPDAPEAVQDNEKLIGYLDDMAARIAMINMVVDDTTAIKDSITEMGGNVATVSDTLAAITDSVAAVSDSIASINDNFVAVNDNFTVINDNVNIINDNVNVINGNVSAINDNINSAGENAAAARDAANAVLDALTPISEQLNGILDKLDTPVEPVEAEEATATDVVSEELSEIKTNIAAVLDSLALMPQAEDVAITRDNTVAILDSLSAMPLADDVAAIRENVSAVLDAVNTLVESMNAGVEDEAAAEEQSAVEQEILVLRDAVDGANADIKLVLEKMEQYEQTAAANRQDIIDTVVGIREEMHINTLDENMSASGMDEETRDALLGEIAEIRERLSNIEASTQAVSDVNVAAIDGIAAQIAELQASLEAGLTEEEVEGEVAEQMDSDTMQALIAELAAIKEKLDAPSEYDTVEEILSLRDDIKAARIVDQNDVSAELESIKNELAYISSGNMLDEIRALREDVANIIGGDGNSSATDGEINLVLNEIVSLRDEVFAFKDEVMNATSTAEPQAEAAPEKEAQSSEDILTVLDELTALREDQSALSGSIDELKDIISRRTTISSGESEDGEAVTAGGTDELNIVLDEIINLKNDIDRIEESIGGERINVIAEQVEEIRAALDELRVAQLPIDDEAQAEAQPQELAQVDLTPVLEQLEAVTASLDEIKLNREGISYEQNDEATGSLGVRLDELAAEMAEIKAAVVGAAPADYAAELAELRAEIDALRAENEQLKTAGNDMLAEQIAELKQAIGGMTGSAAAADDAPYAMLIDEIRALKDQVVANQSAPVSAGLDDQTLQAIRDLLAAQTEQHIMSSELGEIRDEIAQLRSLTTVATEGGASAEVAALRDELAEIKTLISSPDSLFGVAEDVTAIRADVHTLKDEPDLGVMNEILALRDEFQALREQIEDVKRIAGKTDRESDDSLMTEVQSLRDQLFAISMANVNDPTSGESNYESYNNIILDEIAALRDEVSTAGSASDIEAVSDELSKLKEAIDKRDAVYEALADKVSELGSDTNNLILEEIGTLRTEIASQRDADLATLNFMSEMAHLLERQNQYFTENAGANISDEIESLKAEIASGDAVIAEVAKLREIMEQLATMTDNDVVLAELSDIRQELGKQKPDSGNALILDAISRLRDEMTVLAERERVRDVNSDADLADSLSDLKEQLNEIAGIVEPETPAPAQPEKKATGTGKKRGRKPGQKNAAKAGGTSTASSGNKGGKKSAKNKKSEPKVVPVGRAKDQNNNNMQSDYSDLEALIEQQAELLGDDSNEMALNPMVTADAMDLADKLAKQVANKLIMEQLVEQLGDGGVSEERVDEILRDILPQEFTTIAETEASDKVRRLANQLVLNKLRSRLNGTSDEE